MTARELEHMQERLHRQGRRLREAGLLAAAAAIAAIGLAAVSPQLSVAFGVAAAVAAAIAVVTHYSRLERIAVLALDADAYTIPEVAEYGRRCAGARERERLAAWLREVVAESGRPDSLHLPDRVTRYARELERVAAEMVAAARVRPPAVVACRRLLTHAVESPLYNPGLPAEQLRETLERIRRGMFAA